MRGRRIAAGVVLVVATLLSGTAEATDEGTTTTIPVTSSTVASATTVASSTTVAASTTVSDSSNPCLVEGFACGWAMVEPDGSVSGVIVCTVEVCGSGSFAGKRTVLQTRQMEGGNVAGWHGEDVRYDEESNTFTLPGEGRIGSGDRLEDAVFPTTSLDVVEDAPTPEEFFESETEVVVTTGSVAYGVPVVGGLRIDYEVTFDPIGPSPERLVERGTVGGDVTSQSDVVRSHERIIVSTGGIGLRRGTLSLRLFAGETRLATIATRIDTVRSYSSCVQLRRDFPFGVRASRSATDRTSRVATSHRAVVHRGLYVANLSLDRDRDRVVCER
jgi:hypothetical protein